MAIDTAEKRKSVSGIPLLAPGVTPNAAPDKEWRNQVAWSYWYQDTTTTYTSNDDPIRLPADPVVIELDAPPLVTINNYVEHVRMTNQAGDYLVNQSGAYLVVRVTRSLRTNVIILPADTE